MAAAPQAASLLPACFLWLHLFSCRPFLFYFPFLLPPPCPPSLSNPRIPGPWRGAWSRRREGRLLRPARALDGAGGSPPTSALSPLLALLVWPPCCPLVHSHRPPASPLPRDTKLTLLSGPRSLREPRGVSLGSQGGGDSEAGDSHPINKFCPAPAVQQPARRTPAGGPDLRSQGAGELYVGTGTKSRSGGG